MYTIGQGKELGTGKNWAQGRIGRREELGAGKKKCREELGAGERKERADHVPAHFEF